MTQGNCARFTAHRVDGPAGEVDKVVRGHRDRFRRSRRGGVTWMRMSNQLADRRHPFRPSDFPTGIAFCSRRFQRAGAWR